MNDDTTENLANEIAEKLQGQVEQLTPAERAIVRDHIAKIDKPEAETAPDYGSLSDGEFNALKMRLMK